MSPLQVKGDGGTDGGPGLLVCGATGNSCPSGEGRPEGVCVLVEGLQNPVTADLIHILSSWIQVIKGTIDSQKIPEHGGGGQSIVPWSATCKRFP